MVASDGSSRSTSLVRPPREGLAVLLRGSGLAGVLFLLVGSSIGAQVGAVADEVPVVVQRVLQRLDDLERQGRDDEGLRLLEGARQLVREYPELALRQGGLLYRGKRFEQAAAFYDELVERFPSSADLAYSSAVVRLSLGAVEPPSVDQVKE